MQIVSQLELQLTKEKDRLQGMMKHLQLEQTSNGELKPILNSNNNAENPLQMLQSSIERSTENAKMEEKRQAAPQAPQETEFSSRMAAMAAMFPNLPSSITASLAFPTSQNLPSPLSALNAAVQRNSSPLLDRPTQGSPNASTPIRPKPPTTTSSSATLTPMPESRLLSLPPGKSPIFPQKMYFEMRSNGMLRCRNMHFAMLFVTLTLI